MKSKSPLSIWNLFLPNLSIYFSVSLFIFVAVFSFLCTSPVFADHHDGEVLTAEALLKTEAGDNYIRRQHAKALEGFQDLEAQHPQNVIIKRYIGASLYHLKRDDESIAAFKKVLSLNTNDLPSRQFLAKIYLRNGDLNSAESELNFLSENDEPGGNFYVFAQQQLRTIQQLKVSQEKTSGLREGEFTPQMFLKTRAAQSFMNANYEEALEQIEILDKQYPDQIIIKRYKGLILDKLGIYDEALWAFDEALDIDPGSVTVHYFKAQTYVHLKDYEFARYEFQFVIDNDVSGAYRKRAESEKAAVDKIIDFLNRPPPTPWSFTFSTGSEFNTNATSESRISSLVAEEHAGKFTVNSGANYKLDSFELPLIGSLSPKITYNSTNSFYSDTIRKLDARTQAVGLNLTNIRQLFDKTLITQLGQTSTHTTIAGKFYSWSYAQSLLMIYSPEEWWQMILSERLTVSEYKSKGTNPVQTSSKGFGNALSLTNTLYLDPEKTHSLKFVNDWNHDFLEGSNKTKSSWSTTGGYKMPFPIKIEGFTDQWTWDSSFKWKYTDYPKFIRSSNGKERDIRQYVVKSSVSFPYWFNEDWTTKISYTYTNQKGDDTTYTYINHVGGVTLSTRF